MFIHIPKCAGTTARWIMDRQYPTKTEVYKVKSDIVGDKKKFDLLPADKKRLLAAVFGHYCYGMHASLNKGQKFSYVTILRDPVQRVLSLYSYVKISQKGHYLGPVAGKMSPVEFVTSGVTCTTDNAMVRQLCGVDHFTMRDGKQEPWRDMEIPFGGVTAEHLKLAKDNLRTFGCVGISDEFDTFLGCMRKTFGWRIPVYRNQNVSRYKPEVSSSDIDKIRKSNILDYELYDFARTLALGEQK
jgi:hypothetical protein